MKKIVVFILFIFSLSQNYSQNVLNGCGLRGDAQGEKDKARNEYKNRYSFPGANDFDETITLKKMLGKTGYPDRDKFDMKKAVTITGYMIYAATESGSSQESCNCGSKIPRFKDQHIELALNKSQKKDGETITVEITPRMRKIMKKKGIDWSHNAIIEKYIGQKVTVKGWLFYDDFHEKDACSYRPDKCGSTVPGYNRHTCWEIHPVTYIDFAD